MIRFTYDPILDKIVRRVALEELKKFITKNIGRLTTRVKQKVINTVSQSPTYIELAFGGPLAGHMGLPANSAQLIMENILLTFVEDTYVSLLNDRLIIEIGLASFAKILSLPEASHDIPWLQWLIIEGDRVLIDDASIFFTKAGRSGQAIMVNFKSKQNYWRVPPDHAGTPEDNFITKALALIVPEIISAIQEAISV